MYCLAFDGGGVMGVGQARILDRIGHDLDKFACTAGVSIGAVNAAAVATGMVQGKWCDQFQTIMPKIFAGYSWRRYNPLTPRYPDKPLNEMLRQLFPGYMREVRIPLFIVTADLERRRVKVWYSGNSDDGDVRLWEVLRTSVAAPTYFAPWNGMSDGGILANNPSMVAVAGIVDMLAVPVEKIRLCSIGTGEFIENNPVDSNELWSKLHWGAFLINYLLDGAANKMHEYFARRMPLGGYLRIQFERRKGWDLDNYGVMGQALDVWNPAIADAVQKIGVF